MKDIIGKQVEIDGYTVTVNHWREETIPPKTCSDGSFFEGGIRGWISKDGHAWYACPKDLIEKRKGGNK